MARLIDADAFTKEHCSGCKYFDVNGICTIDNPVCGSVMIVNELPTVDSVEVVRCKDCKHYLEREQGCNHFGYYSHTPYVEEDDFCSYGERRTDG